MAIESVAENRLLSAVPTALPPPAAVADPPKTKARPRPKPKAAPVQAASLPYAQVVLGIETSGAERAVDYLVPAALDDAARVGVRVRVRFDEELVEGVLVGRSAEWSAPSKFDWLQKVVSPVRVLTPEIAELAETVAEKYAGSVAEVVRLAVPPRNASAEKQEFAGSGPRPSRTVNAMPWAPYGGGREFISALERKNAERLPRTLWTCLPGTDWAAAIATAMHAAASDVNSAPAPVTASRPTHLAGVGVGVGTSAEHGVEHSAEHAPPVDVDPDDFPDPYADFDFDFDIAPDPERVAEAREAVDDGVPSVTAAAAVPVDVTFAGPAPVELAYRAGRGALTIVPDGRDLTRLDRALTAVAGPGHHVVLSEDLTPAKHYQNWLAVLRGDVRMVIGTRAALFAPVADLGFVALWDDGDARHSLPQAPYPHVREVLLMRAHLAGAGALFGGYACSAEGAQLVTSRWANPLVAFRSTFRAKAPLVRTPAEGFDEPGEERDAAGAAGRAGVTGADAASPVRGTREPAEHGNSAGIAPRLPDLVMRAVRAALSAGPVLIQVPQDGYDPGLACVRCCGQARCGYCHGPLLPSVRSGQPVAVCGWCGRPAGNWRCDGSLHDRQCGGDRFRMTSGGVVRTAEELGEAFGNVTVVSSRPDAVVAEVGPRPAIVVAAPGTEPVAEGGYAAALLLDGWALLDRRDFRAGEEALRLWLNAAALVRPADEGGVVVVMADPGLAAVQALVRWDPVWHARRELEERGERHHAPVARIAELTGTPAAVLEELKLLRLPDGAEVLGPLSVDAASHRVLIRVPRRLGPDLTAAVRGAHEAREARDGASAEDRVRIRIDPIRIG